MIDEKGLLRWLRDYQFEFFAGVGCEKEYNFIENLIKGIENQPKVGEWIPCSEGLPKEDVTSDYYDAVIVTLDNGRVVNGCYRNRDEEWWADAEDGEKYSVNVTGHVIAWMPLPEPYKEDM